MVLGFGYELLLALGSLSCIEQCTAIFIKQTYISIRKEKSDPLGTRVELKNINSFSAIKRAIDAEVIRQEKCRETGEEIQQQTRRRDDLK